MDPLLVAIAATLVILTVWGFISPRGQWRVLGGWSRRAGEEPSPVAMGVLRLVAGIGVVVLACTGFSLYGGHQEDQSKAGRDRSPVEAMWGSPAPQIVNRVTESLGVVPQTLVNQPVLKYQVVDGSVRNPGYLFSLQSYRVKGEKDAVGYIGQDPQTGLSALDTADLVVYLRGDRRCIPQQAVVVEASDSVSIGIFYGQPNPTDGSNAANLIECVPKPSKADSTPLLVPIDLSQPLGKRTVTLLDGTTAVPRVKVLTR